MRQNIWNIGCQALDLVLIGSFEWRELHNLLSSTQLAPQLEASSLPIEEALFKLAHDLCHAETPFSCHVQSVLDRLHHQTIAEVRASDPQPLVEWCAHGALNSGYKLAGLVWAMATDHREAVKRVLPLFMMRLRHASLRQFHSPLKR